MQDGPIINKTGRATVAILLMLFAISTIVWLLAVGVKDNSLHASAMSWSYTLLCIVGAALGLDGISKYLTVSISKTG